MLPATEPAIDPLHHALGNPHRSFLTHTLAPGRVQEENAGLTPEPANDAVVGHVKDGGKFFRGVVPLVPSGLGLFLQGG